MSIEWPRFWICVSLFAYIELKDKEEEEEEESDDESESEDEEEGPELEAAMIRHSGCVNRIRV